MRHVNIEQVGIWCTDGLQIQIVPLDGRLPRMLDIEENLSIDTSMKTLRENIILYKDSFESLNTKLKFYAKDNTGKIYFGKSNRTIQKIIDLKDDEILIDLDMGGRN